MSNVIHSSSPSFIFTPVVTTLSFVSGDGDHLGDSSSFGNPAYIVDVKRSVLFRLPLSRVMKLLESTTDYGHPERFHFHVPRTRVRTIEVLKHIEGFFAVVS